MAQYIVTSLELGSRLSYYLLFTNPIALAKGLCVCVHVFFFCVCGGILIYIILFYLHKLLNWLISTVLRIEFYT